MKILIAEQDDLERTGIRWLIYSNQIPCDEVIEVSESNNECFSTINKELPDIAVIELELFDDEEIEKLSRIVIGSNIQVIVHTSRKTFLSAFHALQLKAEGLFVKPFSTEEWLKTVRQVIRTRHRSMAAKEDNVYIDRTWVYDLLFGRSVDKESVSSQLKLLGYENFPNVAVVLDSDQHNREIINPETIYRYAEQEMQEYDPFIVQVEQHIVLLFALDKLPGDSSLIELERLMIRFCRYMNDQHHISVTAGIGNVYHDHKLLEKSYRLAKKALERRFYFGGSQVFSPLHPFVLHAIDPFLSPIEREELIEYLENIDRPQIKAWLYRLFNSDADEYGEFPEPDSVRIKLTSVMANLRRFMLQRPYLLNIENEYHQVFQKILNGEVLADIVQQIISLCYELCDLVEKEERTYQSLLIRRAVNYIDNNYTKHLSLEEVARVIDRHPHYFSHLFKKETGYTFSDFVQRKRIDAAKELLYKPQLPIHIVANKVGYEDATYFSKVFKRITGSSPREWKSKNNAIN